MQKLKNILPANVFLILAFIFGISFQFITPPFQSPDEFHHFYRAYQIADGQWQPLNNGNRLGGYIPESFIDAEDIFFIQRYDVNYTVDAKEIKEKEAIPLNESKRIFIDFPNTALYSPCSYIPQAAAIFICKNLNVSPIYMLYISRFTTFLFWLIFVYVSIRIIPIYKWLFTFLGLLPISLFINSTISADVVTNSFAFFTIAFTLYCSFKVEKITRKHILIFITLAVFLALSKLIYVALIFLFFLIPTEKFKTKKEYLLFFFIIFISGFIAATVWTNIIFDHYITFANYDQNFGPHLDLPAHANIPEHQAYILNHPFYFLGILWKTLIYSAPMYLISYVGNLGCLDVPLPFWAILLSYFSIIFFAVFETHDQFKFSGKQKTILLFCFITLFTLLVYSQLVSFDAIGVSKVNVIQGRYLIPIFPLLFLLFNQSKLKINKHILLIPFIISILILFVSYKSLEKRYVYHEEKKVTTINWNKENITSDTNFKEVNTSYVKQSVYLFDTLSLSKKIMYNKNIIIKLYNKMPYACTYTFLGAKQGDAIYLEMMKKGKSGAMIISSDSIKNVFISSTHSVYKNNEGWSKIRLSYRVETNYENVPIKLFLWNPSEKDTSYISNFKIMISRQIKNN